MKNKLEKLFFFLILGVFLLCSGFVFAQKNLPDNPEIQAINTKIEDNKAKIESLKKAADEYTKKIQEYKSQASTVKSQLGLLDNQIIKLELDAKTYQLQIDKAKLEIQALDYEINQQEKEIAANKANLTEYIKQIAKNDQKSYLEILIVNDSFAEFFNQINYLEEIQADLQNSIKRLKILKDAQNVHKADKEKQKQELENSKIALQNKQDKLVEDQKSKVMLLLETRTSEIQFQKLLAEARQKQNAIDAEINNLQNQLKDKIAKLKKAGTTSQTTLLSWPVPSHQVTSYFHDPDYPFRYVYEHPAIDIRAKQGTSIQCPADGYVARVNNGGYGYSYIIIIHDNGLSTVYGHVSAIYVKEDNYVKAGDIIGLSGGMPGTRGAGRMTLGPHLHFEVRLNGLPVNPLEYLP